MRRISPSAYTLSPAEKLRLEQDIANRCNKYTMRAEYMPGVLSEIFNYVNWEKENFAPERANSCELDSMNGPLLC